MALTWDELESVTNDFFAADNGKAVDIYFDTSFLLNHLMKQQKGLWYRPDGGEAIRCPLEYDGQESGFYSRGDTLSSDDRESVNAAKFDWKHAYGNATIYRIDELKNSGDYAQIQLVEQRVGGAQKSITKTLAGSIYDEPTGSSERLTGLMACCHETTTTAYGGIAEADLVAADGTYPWEGKRDTGMGSISLDMLRGIRTDSKIRDGAKGKADLLVSPETLFNEVLSILQTQQRFVESKRTAEVGFTGVNFEGADYFPDDYSPSGTLLAINTNHIGFGIHQKGYFMRTKWMVIPGSPQDKTMKILWDGNLVVNNRKGFKAYTGVTV